MTSISNAAKQSPQGPSNEELGVAHRDALRAIEETLMQRLETADAGTKQSVLDTLRSITNLAQGRPLLATDLLKFNATETERGTEYSFTLKRGQTLRRAIQLAESSYEEIATPEQKRVVANLLLDSHLLEDPALDRVVHEETTFKVIPVALGSENKTRRQQEDDWRLKERSLVTVVAALAIVQAASKGLLAKIPADLDNFSDTYAGDALQGKIVRTKDGAIMLTGAGLSPAYFDDREASDRVVCAI